MTGLIIAIVVVVIIVIAVIWSITTYNRLVRLRNTVQESWRQVDVELKRRHDLIPNLVETVKGYASHERGTLDEVIAARNQAAAPGASVAQQAQQEGMLSQALGRLFAVAEAYPNLKANENFLGLQAELSQTEDRIANGRRYYNAVVRDFNTKIESLPSNIIAKTGHFKQAEYFELNDQAQREAPQVSFGAPPDGTAPGGATTGSAPDASGPSTGSTPSDGAVPTAPPARNDP